MTPVVSYLGHPRLSKRGTSAVGRPGSLFSYVAASVIKRDVFEGSASEIKSSMSGTYITIRKTSWRGTPTRSTANHFSFGGTGVQIGQVNCPVTLGRSRVTEVD